MCQILRTNLEMEGKIISRQKPALIILHLLFGVSAKLHALEQNSSHVFLSSINCFKLEIMYSRGAKESGFLL